MKLILLSAAVLFGSFTNSVFADVVYTANWGQSDFSNFGHQGGVIEVFYQTNSTGSVGLPDVFSLSYEFAPFSDQNFSFNATVFESTNELMIGVNETYSGFVDDTSTLSIESAPEFAGWELEQRILDQAGMALLGLYEDPVTNEQFFFETVFQNDDITTDPPPSGVFKTFALTYSNIVPTEVPADAVTGAVYTLFSDTITYSNVPEPGTAVMQGLFVLAMLGMCRASRERN